MVIKVGYINPVYFKGADSVTNPVKKVDSNTDKKVDLVNITPDYAVKVPQKYTDLGVTTTENGLKIYSYKLANGHRVSIVPMEESPTIVKNYVNVGSMNETDDIKGISHFLEHMAFNGTKGTEGYLKLDKDDSFKKIDELGGYTNASTNYALTDYVNSTQMLDEKDLEQQIKVLASMTEDLALTPDMIEKEKGPVSSEIDMILDNPDVLATDQNLRALFNIQSSADELVGGSVKHIQNLTREKVLDYYNKYYTPDNMHLVITGNVDPNETIDLVSKNFRSNKLSSGKRYDTALSPINKTVRKDFITNKAKSATIMIGFAGPKVSDVKSGIISEIVSEYYNSTELGIKKELKRLFAYSGLSNDKISTNPNNPSYIQLYAECSDENSEEVLKVLFDKLSTIKAPSDKMLDNIKQRLLMSYNYSQENSASVNQILGTSTFNNDLSYLTNYESILNSITKEDVKEYIDKYLDISKASVTVIHPEVEESKIYDNYKKAQSLSFKGEKREPLNVNNLSHETLSNNYEAGYAITKNNNIQYNQTLYYDLPKGFNPAAKAVLDEIYTLGTKNADESEYLKYSEDNNILTGASVFSSQLNVFGESSIDNFSKAFNLSKELLYTPRIEQEEFNKAVERIKDSIERSETTSWRLYNDYDAKTNPLRSSKQDLIEGLKTLTIEDVRRLHEYIINNSKGTITVNIPEKHPEFKDIVKESFKTLNNVKPYNYVVKNCYTPNNNSVVLKEAKDVSQADISQTYKFNITNSLKEDITLKLMNSMLSSSKSIGLFDSLREKENLAYSVGSDYDKNEDIGEVTLYIKTSTDNKETGTKTYDNLQKSINGFHRQINMLLDSKYTDADLENAKRTYKSILLSNESTFNKLSAIEAGIYREEGLDYLNKKYEIVDSITREDIDKMAKKVFSQKPVYSIVASEDTLNYNKEFLNTLES